MKVTKVMALDTRSGNEIQFLLEIEKVKIKRNGKIEIICNNPLLGKKIEISPPNLNPKIYDICHTYGDVGCYKMNRIRTLYKGAKDLYKPICSR